MAELAPSQEGKLADSSNQDSQSTLRLRKTLPHNNTESISSVGDEKSADTEDKSQDQVTWGKTSTGAVFRVPNTHSFVHTLLTTTHRSSLTRLTLFSLVAQPVLFYLLRNHRLLRSVFFLLYFAFWRGCYDWGFAWVLRKQSEKKWVVKLLRNWGWLDVNSEQGGEQGRAWAKWWKRELEMKMDDGYKWESVPQEFNAWLMFRQLVDVVLLNDFVSYACFAWANLHFPPNHSVFMHIFRWVLGWSLILFNLWVKMDAHRVVKDYAWYWGDAFWLMVMQHDLVFDGVYEIAPHPMYSVGYAGYYGLSMVVGSYAVLFVSLAAHAAQFAFLLWFENPHIERTYGGGKKPLASRVPLAWERTEHEQEQLEGSSSTIVEGSEAPTPSATEGRSTDFALVLLVIYALSSLIPSLSLNVSLAGHFLHVLLWRLFHSFGLGLILRAQSKSKWLVRHYLKHYHYPEDAHVDDEDESDIKESVVKRATEESFGNWQVMYNISLVMTYVSFVGLAWKTYHLPSDWTVSGTMLRHVLGLSLIALHIWSAVSSYEVLGDFGWLYSDFFLIEQIPSQLAYTGIYRFLNNPERSMGGAAFFGLWLISNSKLVFALALASHLSHWWFLTFVEGPHMQRLYGKRLRKDGGLTKTLKNVAGKTIATKTGKHAHDIQRVVQEVRGSIEKVEEKVTEAVEEFLDHARPMFTDMVNDTRVLLQQSRERMIITRVANDISAYDTSRYGLHIATSSSAPTPRFHVGQPIRVSWTAPSNHSRKDWIGIYRLGSCKSQLVTRVSSVGKWMPIYEEEWNGNDPVDPAERERKGDSGEVVFRGDQLPWQPGEYELRYHHDGKHNVMSRLAPVEIVVDKPKSSSVKAIHQTLLNIVCVSLDSDPNLVPKSARKKTTPAAIPASHVSEVSLREDLPAIQESDGKETEEGAADRIEHNQKELSEDHADDGDTPSLNTPIVSGVPTPSTHPPSSPIPPFSSSDHGTPPSSSAHSFASSNDPDYTVGHGGDDDFVIMTENQAKRIAHLAEMAFGVELSPDVVVAEANVGSLARRIVGARSLIK
ncbi:Phosphatidylethanolamine N-methyltransferase, putative [Cryptococcus gattii WM276]|uniref:Phosphatidylethanolamine N-methyltransferase n=1 Tax=Cryptococcus gattii serotype B (strain WM276 / ATCC MYA-4071) TaxID=367775 RepID=E6R8X4_CRYGW|nr:Phosphatidylethanolamine N-methyltransferase, putative [Cryptococcus gattii WM276]ADV23251.1 Phosphatidylethanolamine N-methyltransferase, putative [Cryptococcus gattii WM276]